MQIIVPVSINAFINALGVNRRISDKVREGTNTADEVMLQVAQSYDLVAGGAEFRRAALSRMENKMRLDNFYKYSCHVRLCFTDNRAVGGFIVLDGELLALHNLEPGHGDWMMRDAVRCGATKLSCWATPALLNLYVRHGFKAVGHESHHTDPDHPGVAHMVRNE